MKTSIEISGQISGNSTLANAINTFDSEMKRTMFNGYKITFKTKKAAKKALWEAFKYLRNEEPEFARGGIFYSKHGSLRYDASYAKLSE
jgi:hypothetical protein